ncbi:MAG: diguanylate cyclase [Planctomycetota bacterium]|nr:MAG: diguanylate cyclase [Planctomycetota bacterium]
MANAPLADAVSSGGVYDVGVGSAPATTCRVSDLFRDTDEASHRVTGAEMRQEHEDALVRVRLGVAASLYAALRCKHQPTAAHSLRVALGCSLWAASRGVAGDELDQLEVAALLHDIGKVGVPDELLMKPRKLSSDEAQLMNRHRKMGLYILLSCCESVEVMHTVGNAAAWYDGSRPDFELQGRDIPLGARLLAIVDAYDAMTTDHVYRPAMSRERALTELIECAGRQFDPDLVKEWVELQLGDITRLQAAVAQRWLVQLDQDAANRFWGFNPQPWPQESEPQLLFQQKLLDAMHDGVVFVDTKLEITLWNRGAERLTGIGRDAVIGHTWSAEMIDMCEENGRTVATANCPVVNAVEHGRQAHRRMTIGGRDGKALQVNVHAVPVIGPNHTVFGATLVLHDASPESSLEAQCQQLHEQVTKDPLTQVANRAAFDQAHPGYVSSHLAAKSPYSLIITDIDHFKRINDTFGHQAGDEALVKFAALLRDGCRPGDVVARYGGEEFVVLCSNCDSATASRRAEEIRQQIASTAMEMLDGQAITASFGVTDLRPGDTPDTMLRRADRALLTAKDQGRNRVEVIGDESAESRPKQPGFFRRLFARTDAAAVAGQDLLTPVPLKVAIEKLRGFVADHGAELVKIHENDLVLRIGGGVPLLRRASDGAWSLLIELSFSEQLFLRRSTAGQASDQVHTHVRVAIRPKRSRDAKRPEVRQKAEQLLISLRSYLMAHDVGEDEKGVLRKATTLVATWLGRSPEN